MFNDEVLFDYLLQSNKDFMWSIPGTRLTQVALRGERKQSVPDAERLLSYKVADYMFTNGHYAEAEYVRKVPLQYAIYLV